MTRFLGVAYVSHTEFPTGSDVIGPKYQSYETDRSNPRTTPKSDRSLIISMYSLHSLVPFLRFD